MYTLIAAFVVFALIAKDESRKAYFIVALMLAAHFAIDTHLVNADYMTHFIIAASFNALTICALMRFVGNCKYTVKTLFAVMLLNLITGLSDTIGIDVFTAYQSAAIGMYIMLIVSIGVGDGRNNSIFELGGLSHRLRSFMPSKVSE